MNNTRTLAIVAVLTAATLVLGVTFAATTATTPSVFAYLKKGAHDNGKDNGKGNDNNTDTDTIQNCKQSASGIEYSLGDLNCDILSNSRISQTANLVVCKVVQDFNTGGNLDPASDFTLQVNGNNPSQSSFLGSPPPTCTTVTLGPGGYQVTEVGAETELGCMTIGFGKDVLRHGAHLNQDYCVNFSQGCSGTIATGETKTCTVTNTAVDIG